MAQQFAAAFQDFCGYFDALCEDRRANPREDLATIVATAKGADGEYLRKSYSYGYYIDGISDKLLPNGQPDGREDKWQENLDPKSCAK